ncbi:MAG TPA: F0F1 ATP synthase subunit delta [Stellaceae bacterium]|nr:F0F1 ATP synthase subunit delta [Stellaceae bacterium]
MASIASRFTGLAARYAQALFDLADQDKALDAIAGDLKRLAAMLGESPDLRRLVKSPVLSRTEQGKAIGVIAERAGFTGLTRNFLGLLARNRRLFVVEAIIGSFLGQLAARRGEVSAVVVAAQTLSPAQADAVAEKLRRAVGQKVAVDFRVDPSLLGGLTVKVGSRMIDASLSSKLHRLQLAMKGV